MAQDDKKKDGTRGNYAKSQDKSSLFTNSNAKDDLLSLICDLRVRVYKNACKLQSAVGICERSQP